MSEENKPKRPRIQQTTMGTIIEDPDAYGQNLCSPNAKKINGFEENLSIHFWIDKHYHNRDLHGDENGKREGIGLEYIEPLVAKSFSHLLFYSSKHKKFAFANHKSSIGGRRFRITLKEVSTTEQTLNVIAEYHYLQHNCFEVTVITAMRKDDFYFSNGDYGLEFNDDYSQLILNDRNNYVVIDEYTL